MSRTLVFAVAGAVVLALAALSALHTSRGSTDVPLRLVDDDEPGRWWEIEPGQTLTLSADRVSMNDNYRCPGHPPIHYPPQPGTRVHSEDGGLWVEAADDGSVTASCAVASDRATT